MIPNATVPRRHSGRPALVVGIVLVVLMAVLGVGITLVIKKPFAGAPEPDNPAAPPIGISSAAPQPSSPIFPSADDSAEPVPTSSVPEQPADEASAKADLDNEVDNDRSSAEALVGNWVPQLSSKRPGLFADGITYDYLHIWANFQQLRTQYPGALLIWSGDYVSFKSPDFYVTIAPQAFPDGVSANGWCDDAGLPPDDCYAKLLSHEDGPSGTTLLRK